MHVIGHKDLSPQFRLATFHKVPGLLLEHRVIIGDGNEFIVTEALSVGNVSQVGIASLAELSDNERLI